MKALIAGAGIGGLTTALFLHEAGIEVELFERTHDIRELGVGINMLPHAVRELAGLGLMPALDADGVRTRELVYTNRFGQIVWQELRGIDAGYEVPQISIHRGRLLGLIHRAVVNRLGGDVISTASRVDAFEQSEGGVVAHFRRYDGSRGEAHGRPAHRRRRNPFRRQGRALSRRRAADLERHDVVARRHAMAGLA
jgi:2-polyprenyl-6-methoxyphenol hydroxylase-like FAD-dependent oxidoreductase